MDNNFAVEAGRLEYYKREYPYDEPRWVDQYEILEWDRIEPKYPPNIQNTPAKFK
jgi:hypothetical protein